MSKLIFTQRNVYDLHQLARCFYNETGIRHNLANENALLNLIKASAKSQNTRIQNQLSAFVTGLDHKTQVSLSHRGIFVQANDSLRQGTARQPLKGLRNMQHSLRLALQ